jgi:rubrerythrin
MDRDEYRNILEFAITSEIEARQFYEDVAGRVEDTYLKEMFQGFAEEEKRHKLMLEDILTGGVMGFMVEGTEDYNVSSTVDKPGLSVQMKPADAIALAMKNEEEAMHLYLRLAADSVDPEQKKVFENLATMERGHKYKMEQAFVDIGYPEVW